MFNEILYAALIAASLTKPSSALSTSNNQVALYWGVNSNNEESLAYYCQQKEADIILLSFLDDFPKMNLYLDENCITDFSTGSTTCKSLESDIKTCQDLGVTVMLSLGGENGNYGFSNTSEAKEFATTLWNTFGEGNADYRPFGSAVIDGFDFDIENNMDTGYAELVNELRNVSSAKGSKYYYISAAPQCVYPDAGTGDMLLNSFVDFAFIQFYNNYCNLGSANFNWDTWKTYAEQKSPNSNIKLFLGLPGAENAASTGYQGNLTVVDNAVKDLHSDANFGGIMLWDANYGYSNIIEGKTYVNQMKSILDKYESDVVTTTSSVTSAIASTTEVSTSTSSAEVSTSTSSAEVSTSTSSAETSTSTTEVSTASFVTSSTTTESVASTAEVLISTATSSAEISTSTTEVSTSALFSSTGDVSTTGSSTFSLTFTTEISSGISTTTTEDATVSTSDDVTTLESTTVYASSADDASSTSVTTVYVSSTDVTSSTSIVTTEKSSTSQISTTIDTTKETTTLTPQSSINVKNGTTTLQRSTTSTRNWNEPLTTKTITLPNGQVITSRIWWLPETPTHNPNSRNWDEPLTTETITLPNGEVTTTHIWWLPDATTTSSAPYPIPTGNNTISTTHTRNWNEPLTTKTLTLPNGQVITSHIWWLPETTTLYNGTRTTKNWDEPLTTETVTLENGQVSTTHIWWLPETATA